jgi:hypothetical protein
VSLDGPFQGWHDLEPCYVAGGWESRERLVQPGDPGTAAVAAVQLQKPLGRAGYLLVSGCNADGRVLEPDNFGGRHSVADDMVDFWRRQSRQRTYQMQLFVYGSVPLARAERDELLAFFRVARRQLADHVAHSRREVAS